MSREQPSPEDIWDRIWRDKEDKVVIFQTPNFLLIGWAILMVVSIFTSGTISNVIWIIGLVTLGVWALLEVFKGVNYFRRALGVIVILMIVASIFKVGY